MLARKAGIPVSVFETSSPVAADVAAGLPNLVVGVLALLASACGDPALRLVELSGTTMGTIYNVKLVGIPAELEKKTLHARIDEKLIAINAQMSTYDRESELSRFNKSRSTDWVETSTDLAAVIREAQHVSELTAGAFDVTVAPLVDLWGFGPDDRQDRIPSPREIAAMAARIGYTHVRARGSPPAIRKDLPNLHIDLSAIAKGYAVDQITELLESLGIANYLVEIGGELRGRGHNDTGSRWRIGIEQPEFGSRDVHTVITINDVGVATSGDYRNYFEKDGVRYSHTINPRTGRPITHTLASVTVIGYSTAEADALATGLMVLGPEEGYRLAEREGIAACFIVRTADGFIDRQTLAFARHRVDRST
jgi:thiamine biosynthesis lipoprotein